MLSSLLLIFKRVRKQYYLDLHNQAESQWMPTVPTNFQLLEFNNNLNVKMHYFTEHFSRSNVMQLLVELQNKPQFLVKFR